MKPEMSNLRRIRDVNWAEIEALESRLLKETTIEQGAREFLALRAEFESWLARDDALYGKDYETRLVRIQERLRAVDEKREGRMEDLVNALVDLQRRLDEAGIPSALIGGLAIGAWAKARLTRDVDIKILLHRQEHQRLLDLLTPDYHSLQADPVLALRTNGIIFVLNSAGNRLDIQLADTAFDEMLISRARTLELTPGKKARVCSAEDLIILKIIAQRPQDQIDVANVVQKQGHILDDRYVLKWLRQFEKALDDTTLIREYQRIRARYQD